MEKSATEYLERQRTRIEREPKRVIEKTINNLNAIIQTLPQRRSSVRGQISMIDYLSNLKTEIMADTGAYLDREKKRLEQAISETINDDTDYDT